MKYGTNRDHVTNFDYIPKFELRKSSTGSSLKYRKWPYQIENKIWMAKIVIISIEFGPSRLESYDYHLFYHGFEPPGAF